MAYTLMSGFLSKDINFYIVISGNLGNIKAKEIELLIKKLEIDKEILSLQCYYDQHVKYYRAWSRYNKLRIS